jgi:hypothetical protein
VLCISVRKVKFIAIDYAGEKAVPIQAIASMPDVYPASRKNTLKKRFHHPVSVRFSGFFTHG